VILTTDTSGTEPAALFVVFCRGELVVREQANASLGPDGISDMFWDSQSLVVLADGIDTVIPVLDTTGSSVQCQAVLLKTLPTGLRTLSTRQLLVERGFAAFSTIGRASQWVNWFRSHRFCGFCGSPNQVRNDGRLLHCPSCEQDFYPRINPCIIVLVTDGERILLARSQRRGALYYSCLAGFIEPGETAEEAVAREVFEEVGIRVRDIRYVKSQPWPFPSQLMLGFYATYDSGDLTLCPQEIAEANWYHVSMLPPTPAPAISVAGQLIEEYCQRYQR